MSLTDEQVRTLADSLYGTGEGLETMIARLFGEAAAMSSANCAMLDDLVFCCTICDNWYEISEMSDDPAHDWECRECAGD